MAKVIKKTLKRYKKSINKMAKKRKLKIIRGKRPSKRLLKAQSMAMAAKKKADKANKKISIAKDTVKGLPKAAKKVYGAMTGAGSRKKMEKKRDLLKKKESLLKKQIRLQKQVFKRMMNK